MDATKAIGELYASLLNKWNKRDAAGMAALIADDGTVIGFDGSMMNGPAEMEAALKSIFDDHPTGMYVTKIREVRLLGPNVGILRAVAGMVPAGELELNPSLNAIQTLVAQCHGDQWRVALFQNTPAAFHGRPHLENELVDELREVLKSHVVADLGGPTPESGVPESGSEDSEVEAPAATPQ